MVTSRLTKAAITRRPLSPAGTVSAWLSDCRTLCSGDVRMDLAQLQR